MFIPFSVAMSFMHRILVGRPFGNLVFIASNDQSDVSRSKYPVLGFSPKLLASGSYLLVYKRELLCLDCRLQRYHGNKKTHWHNIYIAFLKFHCVGGLAKSLQCMLASHWAHPLPYMVWVWKTSLQFPSSSQTIWRYKVGIYSTLWYISLHLIPIALWFMAKSYQSGVVWKGPCLAKVNYGWSLKASHDLNALNKTN